MASVLSPLQLFLSLTIAITLTTHEGKADLGDLVVVGSDFAESRSGYGSFVRPSQSEEEALFDYEFSCSTQSARQYAQTTCREPSFFMQLPLQNLITPALEASALQQVREHVFEYLTDQVFALNSAGANTPVTLPSCLQNSTTAVSLMASLPSQHPSRSLFTARSLSRRFAAETYLNINHQIHALLISDRLLEGERENCRSGANADAHIMCEAIQDELLRLQQSFPLLFAMRVRQLDGRSGITVEMPGLSRFREAVQRLGAGPDPRGGGQTDIDQERSRGQRRYREAVERATAGTATFSAYLQALPFFERSPPPHLQSPAEAEVRTAFQQLLSDRSARIQNTLRQFCTQNLRSLFVSHPQAARQAFLDLAPQDRNAFRMVACRYGGAVMSARRQPNCSGISGGPLPGPNPIIVHHLSTQTWPFGSRTGYSLSRRDAAPQTPLRVKLRLRIREPADVRSKVLNALYDYWQGTLSRWYNCLAGNTRRFVPLPRPSSLPSPRYPGLTELACPTRHSPPVEFQFQILPAPSVNTDDPTINLHRCFHMGLPSSLQSNCEAVRTYYFQSNGIPPLADVPLGSAEFNRQNSENYTLNIDDGALIHEVGHLLGLPDEYTETALGFNPIGEDTSLMRAQALSVPLLLPRHLEIILAPTRCPAR